VDQRVASKAVKQSKNVVDREFAFAAVDKLHGASILQIDAWDHHVEALELPIANYISTGQRLKPHRFHVYYGTAEAEPYKDSATNKHVISLSGGPTRLVRRGTV
jgi:hypothetical protein